MPRFAWPLVARPNGHRMVILDGSVPMVICLSCGMWSERRLLGLGRPCRKRLVGVARDNVSRLLRNLHPRRDERVGLGPSVEQALGALIEGA